MYTNFKIVDLFHLCSLHSFTLQVLVYGKEEFPVSTE